ncbi:MAG: hypothetical protein ACRC11_15120, partial [Xenococcaceae cyanobacterium]
MWSIDLKIAVIVLILCGVLLAEVSMSNPNQTCLTPEPNDSSSFGLSVTINEKYVAVGDPMANYVIIYTRDNTGQWVRTKEISPPKDSTPYKVGSGFGRDLQLDGDVLVIGAYTQQDTKDVTNPEDFQERTILVSTFVGRYLTRLDTEIEVKAIDLPIEKRPGFVRFNLLSEGKIKQITLPDNGEPRFGASVALHKNLLIVGSPPVDSEGRAWLYDLSKTSPPLKLTAPNVFMGGSVAISEQFAAAGYYVGGGLILNDRILMQNGRPILTKTLIRNLKNGSTTVIDGVGELSLSGNILATKLRGSYDPKQAGLLEVFRLDNKAVPHLLIRRT